MTRTANNQAAEFDQQQRLLAALSDDLGLPLTQIKSALAGGGKDQISQISQAVDDGLQLLAAYRLALHTTNPAEVVLEPVGLRSVLHEVAERLTPYARHYSTFLEVDITERLSPALAHRASLLAALQCLGASLIRAQAAQAKKRQYRLVLAAHRAPDNFITTGAYANVQGLTDHSLRLARGLSGQARQPLPEVPPGSASGILIADKLCANMWQPLRATFHHRLRGLVTTIPASQQLKMI